METWFILIIGSVLAATIGEIAQKFSVTSKEDISAETANFFIGFMQTVLSIAFVLIFGIKTEYNLSLSDIILLAIGSILSFFFFKFLYTSYKGNSVSISQVIFSFSVFISALLGIIFFQEETTISKLLGITLIVTGVTIANYTKGKRLSKYNLYALIAAIIYGFLASIDKKFSVDISPHYYQIFTALGFSLVSLLFAGKKIYKESKIITKVTFKTILISTIAFTIFNKLTFSAYAAGGEIGKIDAINNTAIFLIIVFEIIILKDKSNLKKKISASILSVAGVLILGFL